MKMTPEEQIKLERQEKIERLRRCQKRYRMLENGASPEELISLKCEQAVVAKKLEVAQRINR